jgi:8-oxo-dGTP pyrophosphatase MutT (NUDIX family)
VNKDKLRERIAAARQDDAGAQLPIEECTPAAVLIPLVERPDGWHVILTRRTEHLRDHAGQISFPGGRLEPTDASVEAGALREAEEEIGLPAANVELLGRLGRFRTGTGYLVYPIVGLVELPVVLRPDPGEVAEIFEVPLSFILDQSNHKPHLLELDGRRVELVAMPYGEYYIWGATAGMLRSLYLALLDEG